MRAEYSPLKTDLLPILRPLHEKGLDPYGFADEIEKMISTKLVKKIAWHLGVDEKTVRDAIESRIEQ